MDISYCSKTEFSQKRSDARLKSRIPPVSWLTVVLGVLCLFDLCSTVWLLQTQEAEEANPIMSFFLAHSVGAFIAAKVVLSFLPLAVLEWGRRHKPDFVRRASYFAIGSYLAFYMVGIAKANTVLEDETEIPQTVHLRAELHLNRSIHGGHNNPKGTKSWASTQKTGIASPEHRNQIGYPSQADVRSVTLPVVLPRDVRLSHDVWLPHPPRDARPLRERYDSLTGTRVQRYVYSGYHPSNDD